MRTAKGLPVPLTKRMAHLFLRAPDDVSIPEAFRFTRVLSQGGDERFARSSGNRRWRAETGFGAWSREEH